MRSAIYEVIGESGAVCQQFGVNGGDRMSIPKGSYITAEDIKIGRFDEYSIAGLIHDGIIKEIRIQNEIQNNNHVDEENVVADVNVADDEDVVDDEDGVDHDSEFADTLDNKKMPEKLTGKKRGRRPKNDA